MKDFKATTRAFATGMLLGFSAGLVLILFGLIARIFAEYPCICIRPFGFFDYRPYPVNAGSDRVFFICSL